MSYEPIQRLKVENYGCIRKETFDLAPLHALIGPNDSGKSTTLRALRAAAQFGGADFGGDSNKWSPFDPMLDLTNENTRIGLQYRDRLEYAIRSRRGGVEEVAYKSENEVAKSGGTRSWNHDGLLKSNSTHAGVAALRSRITAATMVRFDPNALRRPSAQILAKDPIRFFNETGEGLASVYQAINSRDVDAFVTIRDKVRRLFPTIQNILVPTVENNEVVLQSRLIDNTVVPSPALSEGLLYFLGYAALQYLSDSRLFLVEEPENGLHPARISEVMTILREISKTSQVVIATHSPLVVNELQGNEISVVTRSPQDGTRAVLLKDVPGFDDGAKVYLPGEFWVSYADGKSEAPLLTGTPRA